MQTTSNWNSNNKQKCGRRIVGIQHSKVVSRAKIDESYIFLYYIYGMALAGTSEPGISSSIDSWHGLPRPTPCKRSSWNPKNRFPSSKSPSVFQVHFLGVHRRHCSRIGYPKCNGQSYFSLHVAGEIALPTSSCWLVKNMAMDQYLYIPFLVGWTSIYQLFWCWPI